jgi:hypothetical protein
MPVSALTKNLVLYSNDGADYLHIEQDDTVASQWNFASKKVSDNTPSTSLIPYFSNGITFKESGSKVNLATRLSGIDTTVASHTTSIAANAASITSNATAHATNATAIATEAAARAAADTALSDTIDATVASVGTSMAGLDTAINLNTANIAQEIIDRAAAVAAEASTRAGADTALTTTLAEANTAITAEVDARIAAIDAIQTQVNAILNLSTEELNSFAEVVAAYTLSGSTIQSNLDTYITSNDAVAADFETRIAALEVAVANLQGV